MTLLLQHGAAPGAVDSTGKSAILYAAARGSAPIVAHLLDSGVAVNAVYGNDLMALMWAAGHANDVPEPDGLATVKLLLDRGARIDDADNRGRTALMIAAELGHAEIVDLLLARGARRERTDKDGKRAADLAATASLRTRLAD